MQTKKAILIKTNLIDRDPRVLKEKETLKREGYEVTFLCWDRECKVPRKEKEDGYREIRLRYKAPWGVKILPLLPIWWCFVFFQLMVRRWDIAHAINFDSVVSATIAGKLKRKPVIYEIEDTYEDQIVLPKPIRYLCIQVDKLFMRLAKAVILVDEAQIKEFGSVPNSKIVPIYDSPLDILGEINTNHHKNEGFTLFHAGDIRRNTWRLNMDNVVSAIKDIDNVKLILAGCGYQLDKVEEWDRLASGKIEFLGWIEHYEEVFERMNNADLLFTVRDSSVPASEYICGSKLLEAMMVGRPILVNEGTSTANKVYEENCGLVADFNNVDEIKEAIIKLRDNPDLRKEFGVNARKAYEQRYSWAIMEQRLITLYRELTSEREQAET